ncbi:Beta-glucosidase 24 [Euphorbia peplus]|nr:Beta-glucosidase 24 [Euphorbia peplus]
MDLLLVPTCVLALLLLFPYATASRALGILSKEQTSSGEGSNVLHRSDFPDDFLFGVSTSALQTEGSLNIGGRTPSIWEPFLNKHHDEVLDKSSADTAIDSYNRYKEDIEHVKDLGVDVYRFSISWTRILPGGTLRDGISQEGIDHYNKIIDLLVEYGIKPFVTLYHFDSPQTLEDKYGGFLNRSIVDDFKDYCDVCFKSFGDRVKNWVTINEPLLVAEFGYDLGLSPPGRCTDRKRCAAGNSSVEAYIVTHIHVLSHAAVVKLYRDEYQAKQGGEIGITLVGQYFEPYSDSLEDKVGQQRILDFRIGWLMEPLVYGDYPRIMRELVKERLPTFTEQEKQLVKGSFDFIGINYYSANYAKSIPINLNVTPISYNDDQFVNRTVKGKDGKYIGPKAEGNAQIYVYPEGLQKMLEFMMRKYKNPKVYVTENGVTEFRDDRVGLVKALNDQHRIDYIQQHFYRIHKAIKNGANVKGYLYWSLFDSFEWLGGFTTRFGLYYTDYKDNLKRIPKKSAIWYRNFIHA